MQCIYLWKGQQGAATSSQQSPLSTLSQSSNNRLLELELINRWSTLTYKTFCFADEDEVWNSIIVREAFQHEFLLNGIFAVTALHTASLSSNKSPYVVAALEYHSLAASGLAHDLSNPDPSNHFARFAFSMINLAVAAALPLIAPDESHEGSILPSVIELLKFLVSTSLIAGSAKFVTEKMLGHLFRRPVTADITLGHEPNNVIARLRALNDENFQIAYRNTSMSSLHVVGQHERNDRAIKTFEECFALCTLEPRLNALRWGAVMHTEFLTSIEQRDPFAILMLMHWGVLMSKGFCNDWWARSIGKSLVCEGYLQLGRKGQSWQDAARWTFEAVGLPQVGNH